MANVEGFITIRPWKLTEDIIYFFFDAWIIGRDEGDSGESLNKKTQETY